MSEVEIKRLEASDIELLLTLREEVLENVFKDENKSLLEEEKKVIIENNRNYYLTHLKDGSHIACAAYIDGTLAGCGGVCFYDEMPSPDNLSGKCAYLMNIYTKKEYRKRGAASSVIKYLTRKSRQAGAEKIYLESTKGAKELYKSLGFEPMEDYFKLKK